MENIKNKNLTEVEAEGKTFEEAVKKALAILKVRRNQVKIKVLSDEQKGLFGMSGAKPAKVLVKIISQPRADKKP
jgi:spoIIIJ-associated protein